MTNVPFKLTDKYYEYVECVWQSFKAKQAVTDSSLNGSENSDVHLDVTGTRDGSGKCTASSLRNGLTAVESLSADYTTTDAATRLPPQRRTISGNVTAYSQHHDLDVRQQSVYDELPPLIPSTSSPSSSSSFVPPVLSQNTNRAMQTPANSQLSSPSSSSSSVFASEIYRRSTIAEVRPSSSTASKPLQLGPGSAVARLFGTPSVFVPAGGVSGTSSLPRERR